MINSALEGLGNILVSLLNYLIAGVAIVLGWITALFPNSPFSSPSGAPDSVNLGWLAWLFPFKTAIIHGTLLCTAILTYYAIRVLARWIKLVRS